MKKIKICLFLLLLVLASCTKLPVECTGEIKICPDGSTVSKVLPDCEFLDCPEFIEENEMVVVEEQQITNPNLIADWQFEDNLKDSVNGLEGILKGDASFISGKHGKAISFDGVDDYVDFSQSVITKVGSLNQGTISFWFTFESLLDKQTVMPLFYLGGEENDPDNMFIIEVGHFAIMAPRAVDPTNKKLYATWIKDNNDPFLCFDSNVNLDENKWHHFALVVSPSGNTGYLDGVEIINRNYNFGNSQDSYFLNSIPIKTRMMFGYGRSSSIVGTKFVYYKGALDDFRIYDKPLDSEEIKEIIG